MNKRRSGSPASSGGKGGKGFSGVTRFDGLSDTFLYPGNANKVVVVKNDESGLEAKGIALIDTDKVRVSATDPTAEYLDDKVICTQPIVKNILTPGGPGTAEKIEILASVGTAGNTLASGSDSRFLKVLTSIADSTPDYLNAKLEAGSLINITEDVTAPANHRAKIDCTAQLSNLPDVALTAPAVDQGLFFNGVSWINKNPPSSGGIATSFYLQDTAGPDAGFFTLVKTPQGGAQQQDSVTVNSAGGRVLIEKYETPAALGRTTIDAGVWAFQTYCQVDATTGVSTIQIEIIQRTAGGVETVLFTVTTEEINSLVPFLITTESVQQAFTIAATDKLVAKYYGQTTSVANRLVSMFHNGTVNYSHFDTPFSQLHNELSGLQGGSGSEFYHTTAAQNSALPGTNGTPGAGNKYVTDSDPRNTNARFPTAHDLAGAQHNIDTVANLNLKLDGKVFTTIANEYNNYAVPSKAQAVAADTLLIEDSGAANAKAVVNVSSLPFPIGFVTVDITNAALAAAALTNSITLFALPPGYIVIGTRLKVSTIFTGPALTAYFLSIGVAGDTTGLMNEYDGRNITPGDTEYAEAMAFQSFNYNASVNLLVSARSVGANLNAANQGAAKVEIYFIKRMF